MNTVVAILGRQPEISAAELASLQTAEGFALTALCREAVQLQGAGLDAVWFARLGGTVKLGRMLHTAPSWQSLCHQARQAVLLQAVRGTGKRVFGISVYGFSVRPAIDPLVQQLKTALKARGVASRFLRSPSGQLSSVVVQKQGLLTRGAEFLIIKTPSGIVVAQTIAVHAFEDFAGRDFGRPASNARSGMLPPKLARMLINLAAVSKNATLLDPFCGSGTILQEAVLLGVRSLIGGDVAPRAIRETRANLAWLSSHAPQRLPFVQLLERDVRQLPRVLAPASIDAIVTEPYLGPPLNGKESSAQITTIQRNLATLYETAFASFATLLKPKGRLVFLFPVFVQQRGASGFLGLDRFLMDYGFRLRQPLPPALVHWYKKDLTFRHTLLYQRPGQRVGREIVLMDKQ